MLPRSSISATVAPSRMVAGPERSARATLASTFGSSMVAPLRLMVGTISRCPITTAIEIRTGMTIIERRSLSPRSHPRVDSASGQSWPATTVARTGINSPGDAITISPARI
jgi:hypothetical protein